MTVPRGSSSALTRERPRRSKVASMVFMCRTRVSLVDVVWLGYDRWLRRKLRYERVAVGGRADFNLLGSARLTAADC